MVRLLLVDDNPDDRKLAMRTLERHFDSLECVEVNDAQSLADAVAAPPFDAVITDYSLGWTNGIVVLESLKAKHPDVPVIMFTMTGSEEICSEAMKKGLYDYVLKRREYYSRLPRLVQSGIEQAQTKILLRESQVELERRAAKLAEQNQRKDEFLAMLSHELRNPLAAIGSASALLERGAGNEQVAQAAGIISRQTTYLKRLLEDLLDAVRITRGRIQLRKEHVVIQDTARRAIEAVSHLIEARHHTVDFSAPPEKLDVYADPTRVEQLMINLLSNAAIYTEPRGRIGLHVSRDSDFVVIRVTDTGAGIQRHQLSTIFELFTQGDRTLARTEGGLGVGLAISKKLVELHEGSISAKSEGSGKGSEFIVRLPIAKNGTCAPTSARPPRSAESLPGLKVLAVDDNVDTVKSLAMLLTLYGFEVVTANDGPEAIDAAQTHNPNVVLLDIGLPGMDGYEVARRMRQSPIGGKALLVAITGYGRDDDRRKSKEAGFDHHMTKPVDVTALLALLGKPSQAITA